MTMQQQSRQQKQASPQLTKWIDDPNTAQLAVIEKFSRLVGKILSLLESSMPEGQQLSALKKLVESEIYDRRNDLLEIFKDKN